MPYIKKIELKGFKSFGSQTVKVALDKGFTVITGPNGSGKTNIMDALLFCLGELSTKRLRAENAAKLIFHGSETAGLEKARMAKVIIQFDNTDGIIAADTVTVTISREVYRNGQSVYRLNGRRISRTNILEILSTAGISSASQNIIPQGTITRLTDVNSMERRKIIEDLVGIAQYDAEKAEAEEKLRAADISIRTAMGRVEEVQKRLDDLERERNELLRSSFIQNEIKRFEVVEISQRVADLNKKVTETSVQADKIGNRVGRLKELREGCRNKRRSIESEWRKLSGEIVEEGGSQVMKVQISIGELKSKMAELTTKISSGQSNLAGLKSIRENYLEQHEAIRKRIRENRLRIRQLKTENDKLETGISQKQSEHDTLAAEATKLWSDLGGNSKTIREIELQVDKHYSRLAFLRSEFGKSQNALQLGLQRLKELGARKERFAHTLQEIENSLIELDKVQKEQKNRLKSLEHNIERRTAQKEAVEREMSEAGKIAGSAKEAVVEFATQRELAETVAAEEKALRSIEELGEVGAITGIQGRLRRLIKIDKPYKKAIEAAATGWLDAMVVKDTETAFLCTETLRKIKLGRIKLIPLLGATYPKAPKIPAGEGVKGSALAFVKCERANEPAVNYVFGDTIVAADDKTAFSLSNRGYRAVTINGDLYEVGGAFESGYYRAPLDFSAIVPSEPAIKSLDEAVRALQQHLVQRNNEIISFQEEIERSRIEMARLSETINTLEREMVRVRQSVKRTRGNVKRVEKYIFRIEKDIHIEKGRSSTYRSEKSSILKDLKRLQSELATLRKRTDVGHIQQLELNREKLAEELNTIRQKLGSVQIEKQTLQSQFDSVLRVGYENSKIQLSKVEQQLRKVEKDITDALADREGLTSEIADLEKRRMELSKAVFSAREEARKFTTQIDTIDTELRLYDAEYEQAELLLNQLQLSIQTCMMRLQQYLSQLGQYGYERPVETTDKLVEEARTSITMMRFELDRIGAVNQLALSHYAEQTSRYRELSIRLNELEKEKQAIVQFMDEIENKKRRVFMDAFERINTNLNHYFSKLTGGGNSTLQLENPDDCFQGGIDMLVQFPSKPSIVVSGASGGERSVSAVSFIFALKEFTPASFYVLDEIDAHLDAYHTSKLADLLLEESEKTQFIVITLKPEMVNRAQRVYGVYERNGVSNVVTATFSEEKR